MTPAAMQEILRKRDGNRSSRPIFYQGSFTTIFRMCEGAAPILTPGRCPSDGERSIIIPLSSFSIWPCRSRMRCRSYRHIQSYCQRSKRRIADELFSVKNDLEIPEDPVCLKGVILFGFVAYSPNLRSGPPKSISFVSIGMRGCGFEKTDKFCGSGKTFGAYLM